MNADFFSLLEEKDFDLVSPKFRPFLRHERPPASWTQTTAFYAYGYRSAFEEIVVSLIRQWPNHDYLLMPAFNLARHSVELHLKEVIARYSETTGIEADTSRRHDLLRLWKLAYVAVDTGVGISSADSWTLYCSQLVKHMHDIDPNGQKFRYPHDNNGKVHQYTRIELIDLAKAHWHITNWCDACTDTLDAGQP